MPRVKPIQLVPLMSLQFVCERCSALQAGVRSILVTARSVMRALPLCVSARPKTPLRVLCIVAFDALHMLRNATPLPTSKLRILAALLDLGACANAALDGKQHRRHDRRMALQLLREAGIGPAVAEYLRRLRDVERRRPSPGGDLTRVGQVTLYREAVVRLSLGMMASTAKGNQCLDEGIRATYGATDLNILFRMAMQCQVIDDVLDYSKDLAAGLPSFLTASQSLPQAFDLTRLAIAGYAHDDDVPRTADLFTLRSALFLVSTLARVTTILGRWCPRWR